MYDNLCYTQCPPQTYLFNDEQCLDCQPPCLECSAQFECTTCIQDYMYFQSYCVEHCPEDVWTYP